MKVKTWVIACGLAVCLFALTVVAVQWTEKCKTYELSGSNNRVKLAMTTFTIRNDGPVAVAIETGVDQTIMVIAPASENETKAFAGDASDTYFLKLYPADGLANVTVCGLAEELGDAATALNRGDYATAFKLLRPLADQGDAIAQYNLGVMYDGGEGMPQDYYEAVKWYRKAADQGHALAQYNLGNKYNDGQGVTQDYNEAVKWYRKAADQGKASAQFNLGNMYNNGHGVPQDYAKAVEWFRKAADQGNASAQNNLGLLYDNGQGVPQDYVQAYKWLSLAADGYPASTHAASHRDQVAKQMTPDQIAEAKRLAREWLAAHSKP